MTRGSLFGLLAAFAASGALALAAPVPVTIASAWSRPATDEGVVYATIRNPSSRPAVLVGAASPVATIVELHESMAMNGGSMNGMAMSAEGMKPVSRLTIPPHGTITLKPGGYHLMLLGLHHPLAAGTRFPVTLRFADGSTARVRVSVEDRAF